MVINYYIMKPTNSDRRGGLGADLGRDSTRKATEMADKKRLYAESIRQAAKTKV